MKEDGIDRLRTGLIAYVKEHGVGDLLSPRAKREQEAVRRHLQKVADDAYAIWASRHASLAEKRGTAPSR